MNGDKFAQMKANLNERVQQHYKFYESERTVVENTHEPIISQEIWDRCREIDAEHTTGRVSSNKIVKPLRSLLYCAECGFRMTSAKSTNKVGYTTGTSHIVVWEFYKCGTYTPYGKDYCSTYYIDQGKIEKIVLDDIPTAFCKTTLWF